MDKDEQLIDSLLKEHAKNGGVDEKFINEVEEKIYELESGNVLDLNQAKLGSQNGDYFDWKKRLGIGVAACAAISVSC